MWHVLSVFQELKVPIRNRANGRFSSVATAVIAVAVLGVAVAAGRSMKADLEQGFLGVKWRASAEEVKRVFPDAKSVGDASRPQLFLKASAGVWGVRPASFLLTVPAQGGFNEVGFSLQEAVPSAFQTGR